MLPASQQPPRVTVRVPASTANLGPGFDCLGMALDITDDVTVAFADTAAPAGNAPASAEAAHRSLVALAPAGNAPASAEAAHRSLVALAAGKVFAAVGQEAPPLTVTVQHGIPIGKGLGSSAAAICAGVVAGNVLAGAPLSPEDVLQLACDIEGHPDNAAPALLGGFRVAVLDGGRVVQTAVALPPGLGAVLFIPDFAMPTHETRKLLPVALDRPDVVFQIGRTALLVAALAAGDVGKLRLGVQDRLHQPARGQVFPAMFKLFAAAEEAGALAGYLSGGGPTVCALTQGREDEVVAALKACAAREGVGGEVRITRPRAAGCEVVG